MLCDVLDGRHTDVLAGGERTQHRAPNYLKSYGRLSITGKESPRKRKKDHLLLPTIVCVSMTFIACAWLLLAHLCLFDLMEDIS